MTTDGAKHRAAVAALAIEEQWLAPLFQKLDRMVEERLAAQSKDAVALARVLTADKRP